MTEAKKESIIKEDGMGAEMVPVDVFIIGHECLLHADHLDIGNLREVLDLFSDYRAEWKTIGLKLGIDAGTLNAIERDNGSDVEGCLLELITVWLKGQNPKPTRSAMTAVLQSKPMTYEAPGELLMWLLCRCVLSSSCTWCVVATLPTVGLLCGDGMNLC